MKQKKNFFTKNNILDRGVGNKIATDFQADDLRKSSEILAGCEAVQPDIAQKLYELAQKEQEHAHKLENINSRITQTGIRMGRLSGLFIMVAISYFTYSLMMAGHIFGGIAFAALMLCIVSVILFGSKRKKFGDKTHGDNRNPQDAKYNNPHRNNSNRYYKRKH